MKTFDSRCLDLARYFLDGENYAEATAHDLAADIQQCIEDWLAAREAATEREQRG